ncbi:MAG: response regulator [Bacillota bacterium]
MNLFRNLKLASKFLLGFSVILAFLIAVVIFSYNGLNEINEDFRHYRKIAEEAYEAGELQMHLQDSRLSFKNFIQHGDISYSQEFYSNLNTMQEHVITLQSIMDDIERKTSISKIVDHAAEYKQNFESVVLYKERRDSLAEKLTQLGDSIEQNITSIIYSSFESGSNSVSYYGADMRKHFLLARLHAAKYLEKSKSESVDSFKAEFGNLNAKSDLLAGRIGENDKEAYETLIKDIQEYYGCFQEIVATVEERNAVINKMDSLGPQIAKLAEGIQESVAVEQEEYAPRVKNSIDFATIIMLLLSVMAVILSAFVAFGMLRIIVSPIRVVTDTFRDISEGETNLKARLKINSNDELGDMAKFFNRFMEKLQLIITQNKEQSWLKAGQAEINELMKGEQDISPLSIAVISFITKYLDSSIGAFYVRHEDESYRLLSEYGFSKRKNLSNEYRWGEGLIGQAVVKKQMITISNVSEDYIRISSGVGEVSPKNIVVIPCIHDGEVKCVMELGSFNDFSDIQLEFLKIISESVAVSFAAAEARAKMKELLEKTINQSEELQVQQEELRQSNEELEEQAKLLRESQEQLQSQQEELRVINEELKERSKSLEIQRNDAKRRNDHLLKAQKDIEEKARALEAANRYKSEFLANMSHELRTPLNSIIVLSQLLASKKDNEPLTEKQREFARTINTSGTDLLKLINDILDLSKIEAGKMAVSLDNVNVSELAENVEKVFREVAKNKGLEFSIEISNDVPKTIITDSQRLQQIINNLLSNAIKFTESGRITFKIGRPGIEQAQSAGLSEGSISISVSDTGIGIERSKMDMIFEAFMQSDGTTSRKYGGTGLGLSISRELAKLLGGSIIAESNHGIGSTFSLVIPERYSSAFITELTETDKEAAVSLDEAKEAGEADTLNNTVEGAIEPSAKDEAKKILIIEDDSVFANILAEIASEKGFISIVSDTGEKGIAQAIINRPDAILLDIGLPDMNGWEVIDRLEEDAAAADIPVHVISGREEALKNNHHNIFEYVRKPVNVEKLEELLNNIKTSAKIKKLLIVDNDGSETSRIKSQLNEPNIVISSASSGFEALRLTEYERFDIMIMELRLTDMSGFELLEKMSGEVKNRLMIIVYTDSELSEDEAVQLQKYTESIIIKGEMSLNRLVAEVNLFLHDIKANKKSYRQKQIKASLETEDSLKGRRILIVDDDMRNVFALTSVLEEKGMKVLVGRNGREGLDKLNQNPDIDMVIMDIMMPEMDGYTAMKEIRKNAKLQRLPIIALTAKAMKEDRQKCIEAGANDYLTKPIDVDKLLSLLRVWLYK